MTTLPSEHKYVKILNEKMNHHGFQYKEGLNVDSVPFNPDGECNAGGLYFTDQEHIHEFISFGTLLADVCVPKNARVYQEHKKWKAEQIILSNIRPIPYEIYLRAIKENYYALSFIKNQTHQLCLEAVKHNRYALEFVKIQTPKICMEAIKQNGLALQYAEVKTPELRLVAEKNLKSKMVVL